MAFVDGWGAGRTFPITAYDIKTDHASADISARKFTDYREHGVDGAGTSHDAVAGVGIVFSTVTADQALVAAEAAAPHIVAGTLYLDCNSCAPETKRRAAAVIDAARGRYVDVAVMAPVHPRLHKTPLLVSGPHAATALDALNKLDMAASIATGDVGKASSIKMIRSVMIKGLEALVVECVLAGRRAGVDEIVLDSLEATYPGFDWKRRAAYMLERVMVHGVRRAAEMREVARTVDDLGLA
ncbi:MAG: NAD(P)-dependent oxidoreductase, partial [Hyphomicrobiales bacterium]|nr:NAD(P)-dependent oxidoreductase [Hyphomicrobiales bacterium]